MMRYHVVLCRRAVFKPGLGLAAALLPRQIAYMTRSKMRQKTLVQHQTVESLVQSLYNYNTFYLTI